MLWEAGEMSVGKIRDSRLREIAIYHIKESHNVLITVNSESTAKIVMDMIEDKNAHYMEFARLLCCYVNGPELKKIVDVGGVYHVDPNRDIKLKPLPGSTKEQKMIDDIRDFALDKGGK
jgi:hypothetical protein